MSTSVTPNLLRSALKESQYILIIAVVFSFFYNMLRLTGALFILLIYNRVLPSRSEATLVALFLLVSTFLVVMTMLDYSRRRMLARFGARFQEYLEDKIFRSTRQKDYFVANSSKPAIVLDYVDNIRGFCHSSALVSILDFMWSPIFLITIFLIHWVVGWVVVGGIAIGILILSIKMIFSNEREEKFKEASSKIGELKDMILVSRGVIQSQQMTAAYNGRWLQARRSSRDRAVELNDWNAWFLILSTHTAMLMQYSVLAAGAYLALNDQMTIGAMVACMFLSVRVFYPVERFLKQLPRIGEAIRDWKRLDQALVAGTSTLAHPEVGLAPAFSLSALAVRSPLTKQRLLRAVNLEIAPGSAIEIVGKSGSGKTVLAEAILGRVSRSGGRILLGGVDIEQLPITYMAHAFGYVPQQVAFVNGTVEENITGLDLQVDKERLVEVARMAQVHDLILTLPSRYSTAIDAAGSIFSKSERHQIALARALFSDPKVLVVDEPDQTFREGLSRNLKHWVTGFLGRGGILVILSRLALKTFQPSRRFSLEDGELKECWPSKNDSAKSVSNVVKLGEEKFLEGKIGNVGDEN